MALDAATRDFLEYRDSGRARALARVFDRVAPELLLLAGRLHPSADRAEDLVQNTFLAAIEGAERFDPNARVTPWLVGILLRQARAERRRDRRRVPVPDRDQPARPEDEAIHRETSKAVSDGLRRLPAPYRELLHLRLLHGLSPLQIARAKGCPVETVKTQLRRGKEKLRRILPKGLVPTASLIATGTASRGLAAVRATVLSSAPTSGTSVPFSALGGLLVMKKLVVPAVIGTVALVSVYALVVSPAADTVPEQGGSRGASTSLGSVMDPDPAGADRSIVDRAAVFEPTGTEASGAAHLAIRLNWEDGTPAQDAHLRVRPLDASPLEPVPWLAVDDAGVLELELAAGEYFLSLDRAGLPRDRSRIMLEPGEHAERSFTIPGAVQVRGQVVDPGGQPLPGAEIWLGSSTADGCWTGRADRDGRFRVRGVEPGKLLSARAPGFARHPGLRVAGERGTEIALVLRLEDPACSLRVLATSPDGSPAAGAYVFLGTMPMGSGAAVPGDPAPPGEPGPPTTAPASISGHTDGFGVFVAGDLSPEGPESLRRIEGGRRTSPQMLWVRAEDAALWGGPVELSPDRETVVRVQLRRGGTIRGRVLGAHGEPLAGVSVTADQLGLNRELGVEHMRLYWISIEDSSDPQGRFELRGVFPGAVRLHAGKRDQGQVAETVTIADGQSLEQDLRLEAYFTISGHLRDAGGQPLEGWSVWARSEGNAVSSTRTGAGGAFRFPGLLQGGDYTLEVRDQILFRDVLVSRPAVPVGTDDVALEVPADARPGGWLTGTLSDWDGSPGAKGLTFSVRDLDNSTGGSAAARIEARAFRLGPLPTGRYRVKARRKDRGTMELGVFNLGRSQELDLGYLQWARPGRLVVSAVDADDEAIASARLTLRRAQSEGFVEGLLAIDRGRGRSEPLQPGDYELVSLGRQRWLYARVELLAGEDREVLLREPRVVVRTLEYPPVPQRDTSITETWRAAGGGIVFRTFRVLSNLDAMTRTVPVPVGAFDVEILAERGGRAVKHLVITADPDPTRVLVMPSPF